tara:strand:+ start:15169 stop:16170 length:1002 start_codon:yes stop_codon:yes gene_type:complete
MSMHLHLAVIARTKASGGGSGTNVDEAFFGGGGTSSTSPTTGASNVIDYFDRTLTTGNATDSGDLTVARAAACGVHDSTNGFFLGAAHSNATTATTIDYIDITTTSGNATDVGDCVQQAGTGAGVQGSTYGYKCGGAQSSLKSEKNVIEYITLATTSQSGTDRGDLSQAIAGCGGVSGSTYGFIMGGSIDQPDGKDDDYVSKNFIDYIDVSLTTGNASDKGDLTVARRSHGCVSGASYGFACGGYAGQHTSWANDAKNIIDYIDITTTSGNATDRGDLTFSGGSAYGTDSNGYTNGIVGRHSNFDYFDVTTTSGNGLDRGDRSTNLYFPACAN